MQSTHFVAENNVTEKPNLQAKQTAVQALNFCFSIWRRCAKRHTAIWYHHQTLLHPLLQSLNLLYPAYTKFQKQSEQIHHLNLPDHKNPRKLETNIHLWNYIKTSWVHKTHEKQQSSNSHIFLGKQANNTAIETCQSSNYVKCQ